MCVCVLAIMWNMIEAWRTWPVSPGRPLILLALNRPRSAASHSNVLTFVSALQIRALIRPPLLRCIQSSRCTCSSGFAFIWDKICLCHSVKSLFWIWQWHKWTLNKDSFWLLKAFFTLHITQHEWWMGIWKTTDVGLFYQVAFEEIKKGEKRCFRESMYI